MNVVASKYHNPNRKSFERGLKNDYKMTERQSSATTLSKTSPSSAPKWQETRKKSRKATQAQVRDKN